MSVLDMVFERKLEIEKLAKGHGVRNIGVFGSVVRKEEKPGSDIDFLVEFEDGRSLFDLIRLKNELAALLAMPVDVVTQGALHWRIKEEVLKEVRFL